jgi:hypothetical protein
MRDLRRGRPTGLADAARLVAAGFALGALASPAAAQQVDAGPTATLTSMFVRGVDTAGGAGGNYMVVGGQGSLAAVCINAGGSVIGGPYIISGYQTNGAPSGYGSFPRVAYSQHANNGAGAYLVTWAEAANPDAMRQLFAQVVSCGSGPIGAAQVVHYEVWWEPGNLAVAYSPTGQRFLVAWRNPNHTIAARLVNNTATPEGTAVLLSAGMGRDPSVAWNSATNDFGVSFSGETYSAFVVVPPSNIAAFNRNTFNVSGGILTTMTDVAYNPVTGRYLMGWFELSSGALARVAEFDPSANLITQGVGSTKIGSYDAFSMAYNGSSGTFVMVGVNRDIDTVVGIELNSRGFPFNGENTLSSSRPSRHPRVAASQSGATFDVAFSGPNFGSLASAIATSYASGGGPSGSFDAPPLAPASAPSAPIVVGGCTTIQPGPGWICQNGGWRPAPDPTVTTTPTTTLTTFSSPPPTGCTTIQPGSDWVCVNGGWLPPTEPAPSTTMSAPAPPPPPAPSSTGCTTIQPGSDWVCVNGGWLPPGMAPAGISAPTVAAAPTTSAGCVGVAPVAGWLCIQGGWIPPDHPLALSGGGN